MDNDEAKLILSAYRCGGEDATDPFFAEALRQAQLDPELGRWFDEQRRFDLTVRSALHRESPPEGLRDSLLWGNKATAHREGRLSGSGNRQRTPSARWLAVAAAFVAFLGMAWLLLSPTPDPLTMDQFSRQILDMNEAGEISLGKMTTDTAQLRHWLAAQGAPHDFPIPEELRDLEGMGCQSFVVNGAKVSLVCFMLGTNQLVHLFVIDDGNLQDAPATHPTILHEGDRVAAMWSSGGRTFLLTGMNLDEQTLRRLI